MPAGKKDSKKTLLCKYGVHVDNFKLDPTEKIKVFLVSHAHRDHVPSSLKRFPFPIYCSRLTATMVEHPEKFILHPDKWYEINGIKIYVFETVHCPGSIGFFFPKYDVMYLGDTRVSTSLLKTIHSLDPGKILYDNTHQMFEGMFPSVETSAIMLQQIISEMQISRKKKTIYLCLPHIGSILLISLLNIKVNCDDSLKPTVRDLLHTMNLVDEDSQVTAVGMKFKGINIMPSSQYFVVNELDPHTVLYINKNETRVFASFHAGKSELHLLSKYKLISLEFNED